MVVPLLNQYQRRHFAVIKLNGCGPINRGNPMVYAKFILALVIGFEWACEIVFQKLIKFLMKAHIVLML